jgi:hypothetical protein
LASNACYQCFFHFAFYFSFRGQRQFGSNKLFLELFP